MENPSQPPSRTFVRPSPTPAPTHDLTFCGDPKLLEAGLDRFFSWVQSRGLQLYPAQEEAVLELLSGKNVILNTPTGSGKSLVALALQMMALQAGRRSIYTCPIKALVNEKFLWLCEIFGPDQVGMSTGDGSVNPAAPIWVCTAEVLAQKALREGRAFEPSDLILDEFHYYSDRDRGRAWQIPLISLPQCRFLLMSATLGDTSFFEKSLTQFTAKPTCTVRSNERPVPLEWIYSEIPLLEQVQKLVHENRAPVYLVSFSQRAASEEAQRLTSVDFLNSDQKKRIKEELRGAQWKSPFGRELLRLLQSGIGIHHAGLLPRYRLVVERLAQKGLLKVICGTDTLGVGVNVPLRSVLFTQLCKFDGNRTILLSVRDFHQIAGRAGRRGFDTQGTVIAQAPEHVIENLRAEQKAAGDPKKLKKWVKRKPPEKGYVHWDERVFQSLISGDPEPLVSRFEMDHGLLLNLLSRQSNEPHRELSRLIRASHETPHRKRQHLARAFELLRSLLDRKIVELNPLRIHVDLQEDFSLHHALGLFLVDALDPLWEGYSESSSQEGPGFALHALSVIEAIAENPEAILRKQQDRARNEKMQELKAEGVEFEERVERLEEVTYPKPYADELYAQFEIFVEQHAWYLTSTSAAQGVKPKSILREMIETGSSFGEFIREYNLQRSEGVLLRYLMEVYRILVQTVPQRYLDFKCQEGEFTLREISETLELMIRTTDSSLLEEWEKMRGQPIVQEESERVSFSKVPTESTRLAPTAEELRALHALCLLVLQQFSKLLQKAWGAGSLGGTPSVRLEREEELKQKFEELVDAVDFSLGDWIRANGVASESSAQDAAWFPLQFTMESRSKKWFECVPSKDDLGVLNLTQTGLSLADGEPVIRAHFRCDLIKSREERKPSLYWVSLEPL